MSDLSRPGDNVRFVSVFELHPRHPDSRQTVGGYPVDPFIDLVGVPVMAATVPRATVEAAPCPHFIDTMLNTLGGRRELDIVFIRTEQGYSEQESENLFYEYLSVCRQIEDAEKAKAEYAQRYCTVEA